MNWGVLLIVISFIVLVAYAAYGSNQTLLELMILSFVFTLIFLFIGCLITKRLLQKRTSAFRFLKNRPIGRFCDKQYWSKALMGFDVVWTLTYIYVLLLFIFGTFFLKSLDVRPAVIEIAGIGKIPTWVCTFAGFSGFVFSWFIFMTLLLYSSYTSPSKNSTSSRSLAKISKVIIDIFSGIFGGGVIMSLLKNMPNDKVVLYAYVVYVFALFNVFLTAFATNSLVEATKKDTKTDQKVQIDPIWLYLDRILRRSRKI